MKRLLITIVLAGMAIHTGVMAYSAFKENEDLSHKLMACAKGSQNKNVQKKCWKEVTGEGGK